MMQDFFLGIVEITLGMTVLILLMLLILRLIGGKFTAKCRYILWTLVLIRLAVPLSFGILPALIEVPVEAEPEPLPVQILTPAAPSAEYIPVQQNPVTIPPQEELQIPVPPAETPVLPEPDPLTWDDIAAYLPYAYLTGAAVFLLWNLLAYGIYTGKILRSAKPADNGIQKIYTAVCRKKELRRPPVLLMSPAVSSPAAFGLIRRRIVLPDIAFTENALVGTLSHEVTHCKRGDLWIKTVCLIARSFHWFNPLVHLAAFRCEMEMELSCDEAVLAGCSENTRAAYGEIMLDIIRRCRQNRGTLTTHFNPKKNAVKLRLQNILYGSGKRRGTVLIVLCLVLCLIAGAIVACRTEENSENPASEDDSLISEQEGHTQTSEYEGFELIEYPYTDKVFPRPIHWNSEKIGEIIIVSNTVPLFSFRLYEWNTYSENIQSWDKNGLIWELEAYTHESYEEMSEEFHETAYLIGKDDDYTYVLSLPTDLQYNENDYISQANRVRLEEESQTVLELFMNINKITPNPDCPVSELFRQSLSTDVRAVWQEFLDNVVSPYQNYIASHEFLDLDGNGIDELLLYDLGNGICEIYTIEGGEVKCLSAVQSVTGASLLTIYSDNPTALAPPSLGAGEYVFYASRTPEDVTKARYKNWFVPSPTTGGYVLYSTYGNTVSRNDHYYHFYSGEDSVLGKVLCVAELSRFELEAIDSNPAQGWECWHQGEKVTKSQYMDRLEECWNILEQTYGVTYTEEETNHHLDELRKAPDTSFELLADLLDTLKTYNPQTYISHKPYGAGEPTERYAAWGFYGAADCAESLAVNYTFEPLTAMEVQETTRITLHSPAEGEWTIHGWVNSNYIELVTGGESYFFRAAYRYGGDIYFGNTLNNWFDQAEYAAMPYQTVIPDTGQGFLAAAQTFAESWYNRNLQVSSGSEYAFSYVSCSVEDAENRDHLIGNGFIGENTYTYYITVVFVPENTKAEMYYMAGNTEPYTGDDPAVPANAYDFQLCGYITLEEDGWHGEVGGTGW